jgi:transcriptional regulator of acetoin/glycerol metabolism
MNIEELREIFPISAAAARIYANEYAAYIEVTNALAALRERFFDTGETPPPIRPEIAKSWKRCRSRGLSREQSGIQNIPTENLQKALDKNAYLMRIASPVIRSVQNNLANGSCLCVTYLTDNHGVILDIAGIGSLKKDFDELGFCPGATWDENAVGTNAISLALEYDKLFYTYAPEHYLDAHTFVNCVTAPIHSNEGDIVGTVTVTFYKDFYNDFIMAIISTAAELIEKQFLNLRNSAIIDYTLNDAVDSILILDSRLRILQINRRFRQLIKEPSEKAEMLDVHMLFKNADWDAIKHTTGLHVSLGEMFLSYKNIYTRVGVDIYRIENYGTTDGFVVVCRDISDIIALTQQYIGSPTTFRFETIITQNPQMLFLIRQCKQIADQKMPILLEGESGTGKEVFAQSIHNASSRAKKPFVAVNCAALPINLVESELFGYEKGSFTDGLTTGKAGKFEQANGGTIFLDEIGELPLDVQAKLLRVLDNYRVTRIGGKAEKTLDVRIIAATNRDLFAMVQARTFREDLYYRINVMNFKLPPLCERLEDIPLLIQYFIDRLNMENRGIAKKMSEECLRILCSQIWKGNVRELQNAVTRAYFLCDEITIKPSCLPRDLQKDSAAVAAPVLAPPRPVIKALTRKEMEISLMQDALKDTDGNVAAAAERIGIPRTTFYRKMKAFDITH